MLQRATDGGSLFHPRRTTSGKNNYRQSEAICLHLGLGPLHLIVGHIDPKQLGFIHVCKVNEHFETLNPCPVEAMFLEGTYCHDVMAFPHWVYFIARVCFRDFRHPL